MVYIRNIFTFHFYYIKFWPLVMEVKINTKKTSYLLFSAILILILLHFFPANLSAKIKEIFNLESITNIPIGYTAILWAVVSILVSVLVLLGYHRIRTTRFWLFYVILITISYLAITFIILVISFPDELSSNISDLFNLNHERNVPTWFSTVLLYSISITSFFLFKIKNIQLTERHFWIGFSIAFGFLSLDEAACLHEKLDFFFTKWIYLYAPIAGAFFIYCIYYLLKIGNRNLTIKLISGLIIYGFGGLVFEMISYIFYPLPPVIQEIEFVAEEGLEMLGSVIILLGSLDEINQSVEVIKTIDDRYM